MDPGATLLSVALGLRALGLGTRVFSGLGYEFRVWGLGV